MQTEKPTVLNVILEFFALALCVAAVPLIVSQDLDVFMYGSSEVSFTELAQEALLFLVAGSFGISAVKRPGERAWLLLVSGFFACMFIRELDYWFDRIVHGFWVYPATAVALAAILFAVLRRDSLKPAMRAWAATRWYPFIVIGLLLVLVFSRLFGSGGFLQEMLGEGYQPEYKTLVQEGIELLGYVLVAYGSFGIFRTSRRVEP